MSLSSALLRSAAIKDATIGDEGPFPVRSAPPAGSFPDAPWCCYSTFLWEIHKQQVDQRLLRYAAIVLEHPQPWAAKTNIFRLRVLDIDTGSGVLSGLIACRLNSTLPNSRKDSIVGSPRVTFSGSLPGRLGSRWLSFALSRFNAASVKGLIELAINYGICGALGLIATIVERSVGTARNDDGDRSGHVSVDLIVAGHRSFDEMHSAPSAIRF
jgi:hypothetical protein